MHTLNLIAQSLNASESPEPPGEKAEGICCITGERTLCVPRKSILGKSWTQHDLLRAPESQLIGTDAYRALKYKWERMSCWIVSEAGFQRLDRQGVREQVLRDEMPDTWAGYATTSYKKHGALIAPLNSGRKRVWLFETTLVDCTDVDRTKGVWDRLNVELRAGIGRSIIETMDCPAWLLKKIGLHRWLTFEAWALPLYQGPLYRFMSYLLPSQAELKEEADGR